MDGAHSKNDAEVHSPQLGRRRKKFRLLHTVKELGNQNDGLHGNEGLKLPSVAPSVTSLATKTTSTSGGEQTICLARPTNEPTRKRFAPMLRIPSLPVPVTVNLDASPQSIAFEILENHAGILRQAHSAPGAHSEIVHPSSRALIVSALAPKPIQASHEKPLNVVIFSYLDSGTNRESAALRSHVHQSGQQNAERGGNGAKSLVVDDMARQWACHSDFPSERLMLSSRGDWKQRQEEQARRYQHVLSNKGALMAEISRLLDEVDLVHLSCGTSH